LDLGLTAARTKMVTTSSGARLGLIYLVLSFRYEVNTPVRLFSCRNRQACATLDEQRTGGNNMWFIVVIALVFYFGLGRKNFGKWFMATRMKGSGDNEELAKATDSDRDHIPVGK
jgi:ribose/xylose/arabinose/galactoside ABC-type transport system permease subunit